MDTYLKQATYHLNRAEVEEAQLAQNEALIGIGYALVSLVMNLPTDIEQSMDKAVECMQIMATGSAGPAEVRQDQE